MGQDRKPRLVLNPGLACAADGGDQQLGPYTVLDVSQSGIALDAPQEALPEQAFFKLSIFHTAKSPSLGLGAQRPLRAEATVARSEAGSGRVCLRFREPLSDFDMLSLRQADRLFFDTEAERWAANEFLEQLAAAGDFLSDALDCTLTPESLVTVNAVLRRIDRVTGVPQEPLPPALAEFLEATGKLPAWVERHRLERGQQVFFDNAFAIGVVLFLKVLPTGYCAPALARALTVSGDSRERPVRRSFLVLQMLLSLCAPGAFARPRAGALLEAQQLRMLHAGVRRIVLQHESDYLADFGKPVNQEQMLATIVGFSYEALKGLRQLRAGLTRRDEEDFLYLWQVFAILMGIHPEGQPESMRHVPMNFDELEAFQRGFRRRHFRSARENPEGADLTRALLRELGHRLKDGLPFSPDVVRHVPRWLTQYFLASEDLERLQLVPKRRAQLPIYGILALFHAWRLLWMPLDATRPGKRVHRWLTARLLRGIVQVEFGSAPRIVVPRDLEALRDLVTTELEGPRPVDGQSVGALLARPFADAHEVELALVALENHFRAHQDRRAVFASAYVGATRTIRTRLAGATFRDAAWVERYLVAFANRYRLALIAFEQGDMRRVPRAWRRSFDISKNRRGVVLQDLLLGINAHINHDLPLALLEVGIDDRARCYADHTAVNRALQNATDEIQERIAVFYAPGLRVLDKVLGRLDEHIANFGFETYREGAWETAVRLADAGLGPEAARLGPQLTLELELEADRIAQLIAVDTAFDDLLIAALQRLEGARFWNAVIPAPAL